MINLKLAQYSEEGEFEKFLELGKDFLYGGDIIRFFHGVDPLAGYAEPCTFCDIQRGLILKDEKDPLNRFDGLLSGKTYGNGKFVLIAGFTHDDIEFWEGDLLPETKQWLILNDDSSYSCCYGLNAIGIMHDFGSSNDEDASIKPRHNLFKNPELWEKIK